MTTNVSKKIEPIRSVKGTRDLLPPETGLWQRVEEECRRVFAVYHFQEIRTSILERTDLFARSVGADTDIVTKEMYTFRDRLDLDERVRIFAERGKNPHSVPSEQLITLRPEATASVVRAYIEHGLFNDGRIHKLYYMGPMFRRERPQKGRYRQFYQIGAEVLGSDHPSTDAEVLEMLALFLERVGVRDSKLLLNSVGCLKCRPEYVKTLRRELEGVKSKLCADCQRRAETNPLRVLDCKVPEDQPLIEKLPTILENLDDECRQHFAVVTTELTERGIAYEINPRLVRGLDYYTRTTFEITSDVLGAQNALLGGGRYDGLSEMLGGPHAPGIGFAIGQDRLMLGVEQAGRLKPEAELAAYIVWMGDHALAPASELARELRRQGVSAEMSYEPAKLKKSMGIASKLGARFAIIIGDTELASGRYQVKDMSTGTQQEVEPSQVLKYVS